MPSRLHVIDRVEQRLHLPFVAAVGAGVDVADVHRAAQPAHPPGSCVAQQAQRVVGFRDGAGDQGAAIERAGRLSRAPTRTGQGAASTHRPHRMHRPRSTRAEFVGVALDRPGRAQRRRRPRPPPPAARDGGTDAPGMRRRSRRAVRGHLVVRTPSRKSAHDPGHLHRHPGGESPKLASMNGKSVRMSPRNTS